jgi:hypothetical protein
MRYFVFLLRIYNSRMRDCYIGQEGMQVSYNYKADNTQVKAVAVIMEWLINKHLAESELSAPILNKDIILYYALLSCGRINVSVDGRKCVGLGGNSFVEESQT